MTPTNQMALCVYCPGRTGSAAFRLSEFRNCAVSRVKPFVPCQREMPCSCDRCFCMHRVVPQRRGIVAYCTSSTPVSICRLDSNGMNEHRDACELRCLDVSVKMEVLDRINLGRNRAH